MTDVHSECYLLKTCVTSECLWNVLLQEAVVDILPVSLITVLTKEYTAPITNTVCVCVGWTLLSSKWKHDCFNSSVCHTASAHVRFSAGEHYNCYFVMMWQRSWLDVNRSTSLIGQQTVQQTNDGDSALFGLHQMTPSTGCVYDHDIPSVANQ